MDETSIGNWLDMWFEAYTGNMAEKSIALYKDARRRMAEHFPEFEEMPLRELKPIKFQQAINELGRKYAKSTLQHMKTLYSKAFDTAMENRLCDWNPVQSVKLPKYASVKVVEALSQEEQEHFEEALSLLPIVDHFALMTLLLTGLRRDEMRLLKWSDWDKQGKVLHIRKSKTENGVREIPVIPEVHLMLLHLSHRKEAGLSPYIFSQNGAPLTTDHLRYICDKAAKMAHVRHVSPHILRHSFATRMIERGADPKSLSVLIGHANVAFTLNRYVSADTAHLADQMMLMSRQSHRTKPESEGQTG